MAAIADISDKPLNEDELKAQIQSARKSVICSGCNGRCCRAGKCSFYNDETSNWTCVQCDRPKIWGILASWPTTITGKCQFSIFFHQNRSNSLSFEAVA